MTDTIQATPDQALKTRTFRFYSDPGHGWLKVPHKLLRKLGIERDITDFSYSRGEYAFLEEDVDLSTFHNAMLAKGFQPRYVGRSAFDRRSRIRGYQPYRPSAA